ncbi:MAG TPA: phosphoribosylamine--glycine ligase [Chitinophagaceae bacterium]|nr:phosphoribosylamine--glycine ligase [Chitinophagaceae bacterium]
MNILVLGSGGREHALAWKIAASPLCGRLFIAPGNPGTAACGTNLDIRPTDFDSLKEACLQYQITLVLPGPEDPLVLGISDYFREDSALSGITVVGPDRAAARLEGSKSFAKAFMGRHGIPTAGYREFSPDQWQEGLDYISAHSLPVVLKADGLAAGKGVLICSSIREALEGFRQMVREGKFGAAGRKVVVEEFLEGIELSVFVLSDGKSWVELPEAKDYKRIGEGDLGPNTGGMGAVSPVPFARGEFMERVRSRILVPTLAGMASEGIPYRGFLFAGLINVKGDPFVIEYNCRLGDPETEVVLPRMATDLVSLMQAMASGTLEQVNLKTDPRCAVTTVVASGGYPGDYDKGKPVTGLDGTEKELLFQGGTALRDGKVVTSGGRVIAATALGKSIREAAAASRLLAASVGFEGKYFRGDIGHEFL